MHIDCFMAAGCLGYSVRQSQLFYSNDWGRIVNPKKEIANGKQRGQSHDRQRKTGR